MKLVGEWVHESDIFSSSLRLLGSLESVGSPASKSKAPHLGRAKGAQIATRVSRKMREPEEWGHGAMDSSSAFHSLHCLHHGHHFRSFIKL